MTYCSRLRSKQGNEYFVTTSFETGKFRYGQARQRWVATPLLGHGEAHQQFIEFGGIFCAISAQAFITKI
jgi:hypothetical protein